jgi:hypothetical protein
LRSKEDIVKMRSGIIRLIRLAFVASFATIAVLAGMTTAACASATITLEEIGPDVFATGNGTINLASLSHFVNGPFSPSFQPSGATIVLGTSGAADLYVGATSPGPFGPGAQTLPSSSGGDLFGFIGTVLVVPHGYVSGSSLSNGTIWSGKTFASLGVTPGKYTYSWGSGPTADSLTVNIMRLGVAAPEPGSLAFLGIAALPIVGMVTRSGKRPGRRK